MPMIVGITTGIITLAVFFKYGPGVYVRVYESKWAEWLGIISREEIQYRQNTRRLETALINLKELFNKTKRESGRLPSADGLELDKDQILPERQKRFNLILDQIKSAYLAMLRMHDANSLAYLRRELSEIVVEISNSNIGDCVAVDAQSAVQELHEIMEAINEAAIEQDLVEQEALELIQEEGQASEYRVGLASPDHEEEDDEDEADEDPEEESARPPIQVAAAPSSAPQVALAPSVNQIEEDKEDEPPPQREAPIPA